MRVYCLYFVWSAFPVGAGKAYYIHCLRDNWRTYRGTVGTEQLLEETFTKRNVGRTTHTARSCSGLDVAYVSQLKPSPLLQATCGERT